ncbi:protein NEDD1 [Patella vulgata]|uniref:protein NEDD1 n=1 Tax=Patella vulgata TaxID=6465 RepID=UPI00218086C8|nr:protein NEDD1 [Patella vulgata]XP_050413245.1 protein NEDD1 [Patella vulgata]
MSVLKLVSAGEDVKIWDSRGFGLVKTFDPHDQNVSAVCWSHCGKFLTSCSENDDKIPITHIQNTSKPSVEIDVEKGNLCVDFNSNSRYLLYGGNNCIVNVWDLKSKKLKKSFKEHKSAITSLAFNWNDAYIASGSRSGDIILHNLLTGQSGSPLRAPKVQTIKQIQYHYFRKSLFASASDDGAINLWDANTRQLKHSFNDIHKAPATGLAFSPINEMLLMSVGLDKRIALYDVQGKRNLRVLMADSPLTSIDVMADGATIAVGTSKGKILVYDIRQGPNPVHMVNAHSCAISSLSFHPKSEMNSADGNSSDSKKRDLPKAPQTKPTTKTNDTNSNVIAAQTTVERAQLKQHQNQVRDDVFSPVRENIGYGSASFTDDSCHQQSATTVNTSDNSSTGVCGVFSPLQGHQTSLSGKFSLGNSPLINNSYSSSQGASSAVVSPTNNSSHILHTGVNGHSAVSKVVQKGVSASPSLHQISGSSHDVDIGDSINSGASNGKKVMFTDGSPPNAATVRHMVSTAIDNCRQDLRQEIHGAWQESCSPQKPKAEVSGAADPNLFQTEFTRNLIREALEDFREEIHRDLTSLHVEMLRQFQIQQNEVTAMLHHLSVNKDLLAEVEELRQENKRLKKTF